MVCCSDAGEVGRQRSGQEERTRLESPVPASYDNHLCNAR